MKMFHGKRNEYIQMIIQYKKITPIIIKPYILFGVKVGLCVGLH